MSLNIVTEQYLNELAIVVIGRNEGDRLMICLDSLLNHGIESRRIIYVDSGSSDQSCDLAKERCIAVVELDRSIPFTAARARNAGFTAICESGLKFNYVQFIDGDCELVAGWLGEAVQALTQDPQLAVVCGRRRERYPNASPYNRLADMEWDTSIGDAMACGGDALIRRSALQAVGGYKPSLICGEEPEMCIRLRREGWRIHRLDADMTLHDANMHRMSQWWKRSVRGGWAVAEGYAMYGTSPERYMVKEHWSGWLWGAAIPVLGLGFAWWTQGLSLLVMSLYLVLGLRIYRYRAQKGDLPVHARLYAIFCTLSKFPQMIGQLAYWITRWRGQTATLIEYKEPITKGA